MRPEPLPAGVVPSGTPLDTLAGRLALRLDDVAAAVGVSRSAIERERRAGRFPKPDRTVGRMPLWTPATIRAWLEGGRIR
jgi:predicted DNA-binding transcriptional regulator AlpA